MAAVSSESNTGKHISLKTPEKTERSSLAPVF
jgi:hypothetical protein